MLRLNMKKRYRRRNINREIKDDLSIVCGLTPAPRKSLLSSKKSIVGRSTSTPLMKIRSYEGNFRVGRWVERDSYEPNPITKEFSVMQIIDMICESRTATASSVPNPCDPFGFGSITPSTGRATMSEFITPRRVFTDNAANISSGPSFLQTPRFPPQPPKPKKSVRFLTDSNNNIEVQQHVFNPFAKIIPGPASQLSGGSNSSAFDPFSNIPGPDSQLPGGLNSSSASVAVAAPNLFMQNLETQGDENRSFSPININMPPFPDSSSSVFFSGDGFIETQGEVNLNFSPVNMVPLPGYSTSDYFSGTFQETQREVNFNSNPINMLPIQEESTSHYFSGGFQPSISMEF